MNISKQELQEHYTTLANSRCEFGNTFRSFQQLFGELNCTRRNNFTHINGGERELGVFTRNHTEGAIVHIYDYKHSLMPVISIAKVDNELTIYLKKTILLENNIYIDAAKRILNSMILDS